MFGFDTPLPIENVPWTNPDDSLERKTFLLALDTWRIVKRLEVKIEELEKKAKKDV